jgi:hypothetical protein
MVALAALSGLAAHVHAKPPDLPDNPTIIVNEPNLSLPCLCWDRVCAPVQQAMTTSLWYNVHPLMVFLPTEQVVILTNAEEKTVVCPFTQPARQRVRAGEEIGTGRTVLENLEALEKAAAFLEEAKKHPSVWNHWEAFADAEKLRALVPGSPCEEHVHGILNELMAKGRQLGMCQLAQFGEWYQKMEQVCCPIEVRLMQPITVDCTDTPLGVVFDHLRQTTGVAIVVEDSPCLKERVTFHVKQMPARLVIDMLATPAGMVRTVRGNVVCLTSCKLVAPESAPRGEECCAQKSACPRCETLHAQYLKKQITTAKRSSEVVAQVNGLMKACYKAIENCQHEAAIDLARKAHELDSKRVEGDPLVYKFHLLAEKQPPRCGLMEMKPSNNYPEQTRHQSLRPAQPLGEADMVDGKLVKSAASPTRKGCGLCCVCQELSCCGVTLADAARWMAKLYLEPMIPGSSDKGCLSLGLSSTGHVNAFLQAPHDGVIYHVMLKDGVFFMWMKPQARSH